MAKQIKVSDCSISLFKQTVSRFIESYSDRLFGREPVVYGAKNRFGKLKIAEEVMDMKDEIRQKWNNSNIFECDRGVMVTLFEVLTPNWYDGYKQRNYVLALLADSLSDDCDFDIRTIGILSLLAKCSHISWSSERLKLKWDALVDDLHYLHKVHYYGTHPLSFIPNFTITWGNLIHCYFFGQCTVRSSETFSWRECLKWLGLKFEFNVNLLKSGREVYDCIIHAGDDYIDCHGVWCNAIDDSEAARCANDSTDIL